MPALIKANSALLAGNAQLINYNIATSADGSLAISAEFVVLAQFASSAYSTFKIGSDLHPSLKAKGDVIAALQNYNSPQLPTLTGVDIVTENGLCTIKLSYSGETEDLSGTNPDGTDKVTKEITTSTDLRSLSGALVFSPGTESELSVSYSFDYYATSVTVQGGAATAVRPGNPFNIRKGADINVLEYITTQEVYSRRVYLNNLKQTKTTNTVTMIYIQNKFFG